MRKDRIFRTLGTLGALISIYKVFLGELAMIDFMILGLISVAIYSIGNEIKHNKHLSTAEVCFPVSQLQGGVPSP